MGIFLPIAAYGYEAVSGPTAFCTATSQTAGYTYFKLKSPVDVTIPQWTVRVLNTLTGSLVAVLNSVCFSCNAQYSTASYGGSQANSNVSTRSTNGAVRAYGLVGQIAGFSSESCYVDSWDNLSTGPECSRGYSTFYGNTSYLNVVKDTTKYISGWSTNPGWGNQPYINTCATYTTGINGSISYVSCSTGTAVTSSSGVNSGSYCSREFQWFTNSPNLTIKNYYSSSCGTY